MSKKKNLIFLTVLFCSSSFPTIPLAVLGYIPKNTALRTESDTAVTHVGSSQVGAVLCEIV